jgi:hypothetical protein
MPAEAETLAHRGNDLRHLFRRRTELVAQHVQILHLGIAAEGLAPGPVCRRAALFRAAAPKHALVGNTGAADELLDRARLADAAFAREKDQAPVSGASGVEARHEGRELRFPADEEVCVAGACLQTARL